MPDLAGLRVGARVGQARARLDSLFARLLLAQLVLVLSCVTIFGGFVIVERNALQMPHFAEAWAPAFRAAVATPLSVESAPVLGLPDGIRRHAGPPSGLTLAITGLPSAALLRQQLAQHGVRVDEVRLAFTGGSPRFWSLVVPPGQPGVWLSGRVPSVLPRWTTRTTVTLTLLLIVVGLVSRSLARHVTQPLGRLRQRMQAHAQSADEARPPPLAAANSKAPPELVAMDAAYTLLSQRLQRNEHERALLLAGVSHDLRSPLARIRLAAEMLPESADNQDGVAAITRNVDHADRLIASFLDFVRTSAPDQAQDDTVDLASLARLVVLRFDRPPGHLQLQAPAHLVLHHASALLLDRLMFNLVDNALKHGATPVQLTLGSAGQHALITVTDAGPGLPPARAQQLMQAFARGDASRGAPGSGLGLAIAQQIVTRLQGTLDFALTAAGHQVQVRLPLER